MTSVLDSYDIDRRIGLRRARGTTVGETGLIHLAASLPADQLVAVAGWLSCHLIRPDRDHRELQRDASRLLLPTELTSEVIALIDLFAAGWAPAEVD